MSRPDLQLALDGAHQPGSRSKRFEQRFVLGVRADPEPHQGIGLEDTDGPPVQIDPGRKDGEGCMNLLEAQRRMGRVLHPLKVGGLDSGMTRRRCSGKQQPEALGRDGSHRLSSGMVRPARNSASASGARASRTCSDFEKVSDQRCSERISSRRIAARMSCSSGGSFVASATADVSACVMLGTSRLSRLQC